MNEKPLKAREREGATGSYSMLVGVGEDGDFLS